MGTSGVFAGGHHHVQVYRLLGLASLGSLKGGRACPQGQLGHVAGYMLWALRSASRQPSARCRNEICRQFRSEYAGLTK